MGEKLLITGVSWWKVKAQWATVTLDAQKFPSVGQPYSSPF